MVGFGTIHNGGSPNGRTQDPIRSRGRSLVGDRPQRFLWSSTAGRHSHDPDRQIAPGACGGAQPKTRGDGKMTEHLCARPGCGRPGPYHPKDEWLCDDHVKEVVNSPGYEFDLKG